MKYFIFKCGCEYPRSDFKRNRSGFTCPEHKERIDKVRIVCKDCGKDRFTNIKGSKALWCEDCYAIRFKEV